MSSMGPARDQPGLSSDVLGGAAALSRVSKNRWRRSGAKRRMALGIEKCRNHGAEEQGSVQRGWLRCAERTCRRALLSTWRCVLRASRAHVMGRHSMPRRGR